MATPQHPCHALEGFFNESFATLHGPLDRWAHQRPEAVALRNEHTALSFAQLQQRVQLRMAEIARQNLPETVLLPTTMGVLDTLVEFLAVIASGRCAALGDPAWPAHILTAVAASITGLPKPARVPAATVAIAPALAPCYIGFTSGSTGQPKGFRRNHLSWTESFRTSVADFGACATGTIAAPGRLSHSLFLFAAMMGLWTGAGAVVQERFSASATLASLAQGQASVLLAVPSQLLLMLDVAQRQGQAPIMATTLILISGARWMREQTPHLRHLFPNARLIEFYGASETSYVAWREADGANDSQVVGQPFSNVELRIGDLPLDTPYTTGTAGRIWVRSPMLFMDYVHTQDPTAAMRHDGWLSVRDMGWLDAQGQLYLCGRENRMLVTQGKNVFPEEVESCLLTQAEVEYASVLGLPDRLRGHRIHAVVQLKEGAPHFAKAALVSLCRRTLEPYKTPRQWWLWQGPWPLTRNGKTDHARIAQILTSLVRDNGPKTDEGITPWR